ncbi:hypothetical protein A9G27_11105 [Gilliamella sp. Bim3-2]|nr:hypothetical protein A9G32_07100 [Gilliamella apicola]OCG49557.1 hypothetical protein A9G27_03120 [Gilliamella apicola]OCG52020.1 hypothetical protein A9G27_11105 [Gilliamella apicola]
MRSEVVADNACDSKEYGNNNNSANANGIFKDSFVDNFENNSKNNLEGINKFRVKTCRIGLFDKFKT